MEFVLILCHFSLKSVQILDARLFKTRVDALRPSAKFTVTYFDNI